MRRKAAADDGVLLLRQAFGDGQKRLEDSALAEALGIPSCVVVGLYAEYRMLPYGHALNVVAVNGALYLLDVRNPKNDWTTFAEITSRAVAFDVGGGFGQTSSPLASSNAPAPLSPRPAWRR